MDVKNYFLILGDFGLSGGVRPLRDHPMEWSLMACHAQLKL